MTKPTRQIPSNASPGVSLERVLSKLGVATRTQAAALIESGRISVNGRAVRDPRRRIDMGRDTVAVDGEIARAAPRRYLALNKPRGLVTTLCDEQGRTTVYHCLKEEDKRLAPVGRLDKASEGLLLFTNDAQWAHRILNPDQPIPKTYHVQVDRRLTDTEIARLCAGVEIEPGVTTRPARIDLLRSGDKTCWLEITLYQGLNRQIRRMIESVDAGVLRLIRIRIGPIELGTLAKGQTRPLTKQELARLPSAK